MGDLAAEDFKVDPDISQGASLVLRRGGQYHKLISSALLYEQQNQPEVGYIPSPSWAAAHWVSGFAGVTGVGKEHPWISLEVRINELWLGSWAWQARLMGPDTRAQTRLPRFSHSPPAAG